MMKRMKHHMTRRLLLLLTLAAAFAALSPGAASAATCEPAIDSITASPYWASYSDYTSRLLTVDEYVSGSSACDTCRYQVEEVTASQGVTAHAALPASLENLDGGPQSRVTIRFQVPDGINSFSSSLRVTCQPQPALVTAELTIDPEYALANEGCPEGPVPELAGLPLPADQQYGSRPFTVTLTDTLGRPLAGRTVKWSLSNSIDFRFLSQETVTDENGRATAVITPPQYFTDIAPYFDKGSSLVSAVSEGGSEASALFVYTRCAPVGERPPWQ